MFLSVIIPVYNVAPYLRRGLDSVVAQGGDDYEVILVDDGSTDGSPAICDEYSSRYPFVKTYHIPNGGVGHARNYGIDHAQGEFLQFIDSDDFIDEGLYSRFREVARENSNIDACFFGLKDVDTNGKADGEGHFVTEGLYRKELEEGAELSLQRLYLSVKQAFLFFFPTTKFFKRTLVKDNNIRFREDLHYFEDYLFNLQFFYFATKVYAIGGKAYYNYVHHPGEHLGGKYTPASVITSVAEEIYERSERLPKDEALHRYNVLEYYNNLLGAVDSTYNVLAKGAEAKTMPFIRHWLAEIRRLGYRKDFAVYLGRRKSLLAMDNAYYVYAMQSVRVKLLKFLRK